MNRRILFVILVFIINACKVQQEYGKYSDSSDQKKQHKADSCLSITISSNDLSEDLSPLSTGNDELLFLLYSESDSNNSLELLIDKSFIFDSVIHKFNIIKNININSDLILFLIEVDTKENSIQIEPVIRAYHSEISKAAEQGNATKISEYLGDNDLLGTYSFHKKEIAQKKIVNFNGINLFDSYEYQIEFELKMQL